MLNQKEAEQIREELLSCKRPFFFFHDDTDGLASFLLLYRLIREGKGHAVKAYPHITSQFARIVEEYCPDIVFILDIAIVDQEFLDLMKMPVIWIDHHAVLKRERVKYYNSRLRENLNVPTAYLCWQIVQQDLWLAMAGCIGDWYIPDFTAEFQRSYPDLLPKEITTPEMALFETQLGFLAKILSFNLKGSTSEVLKSIKVLTRVGSPYELLNRESAQARLIYKRYEQVNKDYESLKAAALEQDKQGKLFVFTYTADNLSLTKDLANELLYMFPKRLIILGREKSGEMRCSIRSGKGIALPGMIEKALAGIEGYCGGHEHAYGACVKKEDFQQFLDSIRNALHF